ncbi:MAG: DUF4255 domain-containing protein [Ilumatobacteraceae bacterium]
MLDLIDETIEAFFRATVPLGAADVDVSFEPPERDWSSKLNRPTVNAFLWDIRRGGSRSKSGMETFERNGETVRRMALPAIELRYVVTAWTSDHGDERALLAGLMRTILGHGRIPEEYLSGSLAELGAPEIFMARSGEEHVDVFRALDGQLKPGINLIVHAKVDTGLVVPAGPPTGGVDLATADSTGTARSEMRRVAGEILDPDAVGAAVISPSGGTTVNQVGQFLIKARPGDEVVIQTDPPRTVTVPETGGIRVS